MTMTAQYVHRPCKACKRAERPGGPIDQIREIYNLADYDIRRLWSRKTRPAKKWSSITSKIPFIRVQGTGEGLFFIGFNGISKLAQMCKEGKAPRPKDFTPEAPVKMENVSLELNKLNNNLSKIKKSSKNGGVKTSKRKP